MTEARGYRAELDRRQRRLKAVSLWGIVPLVGALELMRRGVRPGWQAWMLLAVAGMAGHTLYTLKLMRCPACGKFVRALFEQSSCPRCGAGY